MTVASEIARIQGVKANILDAIAAKGVTVPSDAMLADCPSLISSISGGSIDLSHFNIITNNVIIGSDLIIENFQDNNIYLCNESLVSSNSYEIGIRFYVERYSNVIAIVGGEAFGGGYCVNFEITNNENSIYIVTPGVLSQALTIKKPNLMNKWIFIRFTARTSGYYSLELTEDFKTWEKVETTLLNPVSIVSSKLTLGRVGSSATYALNGKIDLKNTYLKINDQSMYGCYKGG